MFLDFSLGFSIISMLWPDLISVGWTFLRNKTTLKSRNVEHQCNFDVYLVIKFIYMW